MLPIGHKMQKGTDSFCFVTTSASLCSCFTIILLFMIVTTMKNKSGCDFNGRMVQVCFLRPLHDKCEIAHLIFYIELATCFNLLVYVLILQTENSQFLRGELQLNFPYPRRNLRVSINLLCPQMFSLIYCLVMLTNRMQYHCWCQYY